MNALGMLRPVIGLGDLFLGGLGQITVILEFLRIQWLQILHFDFKLLESHQLKKMGGKSHVAIPTNTIAIFL